MSADVATELVWPHHYGSADGADVCDQSGLPAEADQLACDRGHEVAPLAVEPLIPRDWVRAS